MLTATILDIREIQDLKSSQAENQEELIQRLEADKEKLEEVVTSLKEEMSQEKEIKEQNDDKG